MNQFEHVDITIDKAKDLEVARNAAHEIASTFFGDKPGAQPTYELEQTNAYPEQQVITNASGAALTTGPATFYVTFVARRAL